MRDIDIKMVDTYYKLIKAGRRNLEDIPAHVPAEVKSAVQNLLNQDQEA